METLDQNYWTQRYEKGDTSWDAGSITTPLREYIDRLKNKDIRILIPGAGNAHEAEYLVNAGFSQVHVCDLAAPPLARLKEKCPSLTSAQLIQGDFFELKGQYDLIIEQTFFCAINPNLRANYFTKMLELLVPRGILMGLLFDDTLNTDHPPFGGNKAEYLNHIPTTFEIVHLDPCYNSIAPRQGRELFMQLQKK
jgi:hypothetical protein